MRIPADVRTFQARANLYQGDRGPWLEHMVEDCGCSIEEASMLLADYEMIPVKDESRGHMATIIKRNKEIHLAVYRKFRRRNQVTVEKLTQYLKPLLDKNLFLVTKVAADEDSRFIERVGFEKLGSTMDGMKTYILNEIKYPRAHHEHH